MVCVSKSGNEPLGSVKCGQLFLGEGRGGGKVSKNLLFQKDCAPLSLSVGCSRSRV